MPSKLSAAALATTLVVVAATAGEPEAPAASAPNLLRNGELDKSAKEWRIWGATGKLTPDDRASFFSFVHDGTLDRTVLQLRESFPEGRVYLIQRVDLKEPPAKGYTLSFRAKAEAGAKLCGGIMYNTVGEDGKEKFLLADSDLLTGTGDWVDYAIACRRPPASASRLYVFLDATDGRSTSTGVAWFADARLTPGVPEP